MSDTSGPFGVWHQRGVWCLALLGRLVPDTPSRDCDGFPAVESRHGLRDARHSRGAGAGSGHRGDHDADLPDLHVRAGGGRRAQGLRLLARRQPDAVGAAAVPRLARVGRPRDRLLVRARCGHDADAPRRSGPARRAHRRRLRRRLPDDVAGVRAEGLHLRLRPRRRVPEPARPARRQHAHRLDRVAVEPDAQRRRHSRGRRRRARGRRAARRGQHLRDAVSPATAGARRRRRRPLDDEVPRRPLRRRRRIRRDERPDRRGAPSPSCRSPSARFPARSTRGSSCAASRRSQYG